MQVQKVIERLGYSANEAKVYLAALALGEAHISEVAARAKLPRTSAQTVIDKLHKDGLVNFYVQRRYKYWVAENPEQLLASLRRREEAMREAMPTLNAMRREHWKKPSRGKSPARDIGFFRILADGADQPLLIANEEIEIEYVNVAWERQFGYALEDVRGENPRMLKSGKTPESVYERMWESLRSGSIFQSDEIIDKRKDGTHFNLLTTIFLVNHQGALYYIQILDDIMERKRVEQLYKTFLKAVKPE